MRILSALSLILALSLAAAPAAAFEFTRVEISPLASEHLCPALGGKELRPQVTITHSRLSGHDFTIRVYQSAKPAIPEKPDEVRSTETDLGQMQAKSSASGQTMLRPAVTAPCPQNKEEIVTYWVAVSDGSRTKHTRWGRFDGPSGEIDD